MTTSTYAMTNQPSQDHVAVQHMTYTKRKTCDKTCIIPRQHDQTLDSSSHPIIIKKKWYRSQTPLYPLPNPTHPHHDNTPASLASTAYPLPPISMPATHGPLSSSDAPKTPSTRFNVSTSKSVTQLLPSGSVLRTSNALSSMRSSFHRRLGPSYTHRTRFFIFILSVAQPQLRG